MLTPLPSSIETKNQKKSLVRDVCTQCTHNNYTKRGTFNIHIDYRHIHNIHHKKAARDGSVVPREQDWTQQLNLERESSGRGGKVD